MQLRGLLFACSLVVTFSAAVDTIADDWSMYGRDRKHNAVSPERNPPADWDVGKFDIKTGWLCSNWVGYARLAIVQIFLEPTTLARSAGAKGILRSSRSE